MNGIFDSVIILSLYICAGLILSTVFCYLSCQDTRSIVHTQNETNTFETTNQGPIHLNV